MVESRLEGERERGMSWLSYPPEYVNAVAQSCLVSEKGML